MTYAEAVAQERYLVNISRVNPAGFAAHRTFQKNLAAARTVIANATKPAAATLAGKAPNRSELAEPIDISTGRNLVGPSTFSFREISSQQWIVLAVGGLALLWLLLRK